MIKSKSMSKKCISLRPCKLEFPCLRSLFALLTEATKPTPCNLASLRVTELLIPVYIYVVNLFFIVLKNVQNVRGIKVIVLFRKTLRKILIKTGTPSALDDKGCFEIIRDRKMKQTPFGKHH